jgi:hypothetical protein
MSRNDLRVMVAILSCKEQNRHAPGALGTMDNHTLDLMDLP